MDGKFLYVNKNDPNRKYFIELQKDIVKTADGYRLQNTYEEVDERTIRATAEYEANPNQNQDTKNCGRCIHRCYKDCTIRTALENLPEYHFIPYYWNANCDAYTPVWPLTLIKSEKEMVDFIAKAENFFGGPEDYEAYFGFERKWDEKGDGDILETTMEYYDRGGKFKSIPDKYPCVVYFGIVDFDGNRGIDEKLDWIYVGD
jgi:hypothetical protein